MKEVWFPIDDKEQRDKICSALSSTGNKVCVRDNFWVVAEVPENNIKDVISPSEDRLKCCGNCFNRHNNSGEEVCGIGKIDKMSHELCEEWKFDEIEKRIL